MVSKFTRYSGRSSRILMPSSGGRSWSNGEASRRSATAPTATGVGIAVVEELVGVEQV